MKFKGQSFKCANKQYTLKQQLGEGGFSMIYSTSDLETIAKVQVLSNPEIMQAYTNEKSAMSSLQHKNIVTLKDFKESKDKEGHFGFLFMQNCNSGNAFNILEKYENREMPEKVILKIMYAVASALEYMHEKGVAHRDIKLENVLVNSKGEFKLCDFGSSSKQKIKQVNKQNRVEIEENIEKTTTPLYRSPEQLDLYSGFEIGTKVDVFALGVLAFMLCFQKQPFESRLSAINKQYFVPEETSYSSQLISLIDDCFITNPILRPSASKVKEAIKNLINRKVAQIELNLVKELEQTSVEYSKINSKSLLANKEVAETGFFDKIKRIYNQITTETEGWIAGFAEDNEQAPELKYNRSIISKCWDKRYKVQKLYEIIQKYSEDSKSKCLVNIKLLILLHNFLRKGPPESMSYDGQFSLQKICCKIYRNWRITQKPTNSDDIKRNSYVCLIIKYYSLILVSKWKLCFENSDLIEGNYSILPFLESKKEKTLLRMEFFEELLHFLSVCADLHQILNKHSYLVDIQRSIILSLVDEEYCLISLIVFLLCGFKEAIPYYGSDLDFEKLSKKLRVIEKKFREVFFRVSKLFEAAQKLASLFEGENQFLLANKIPSFIESIDYRTKQQGSFEFNKHINYSRTICGLRIPVSYEEAVKNPNYLKTLEQKAETTKGIEIREFQVKNQPPKEKCSQGTAKKQTENTAFSHNPFSKFEEKPSQGDKRQGGQTKSVINDHFMEFTHQNLNRDMSMYWQNSGKGTTSKVESSKANFQDFLSIVDQKYQQSNGNQQEKQTTASFANFETLIPKAQQKNNSPSNQRASDNTSAALSEERSSTSGNHQKKPLEEEASLQGISNLSKDVYTSLNPTAPHAENGNPKQNSSKAQISEKREGGSQNMQKTQKVELINFFDEDDDSEMKK